MTTDFSTDYVLQEVDPVYLTAATGNRWWEKRRSGKGGGLPTGVAVEQFVRRSRRNVGQCVGGSCVG